MVFIVTTVRLVSPSWNYVTDNVAEVVQRAEVDGGAVVGLGHRLQKR